VDSFRLTLALEFDKPVFGCVFKISFFRNRHNYRPGE
jgi:hypothetical protein